MKRFFGKKFKNEIIIENDEFIHLSKVLRLKENDKIICNINDEFNYFCTIKEIGKKNCVTTINSKELCPALPNKKITLFQALPKKEYIDEIIPKSVELGLTNLQFFISDFSNTKTINETRINQQILSACKQCERSMLMQNFPLITFKEMTEKLEAGVEVRGRSQVLQNTASPSKYSILTDRVVYLQTQIIRKLAGRGPCVIVGRCSDYVLRDRTDVLNAFVYAPEAQRLRHIMDVLQVSEEAARVLIEKNDRQLHARYKQMTGTYRGDRHNRHILIDSSVLGFEKTAKFIEDFAKQKFGG